MKTNKVGSKICAVLGGLVVAACGAKVDVLEKDPSTLGEREDEGMNRWDACQPTELEVRALTGDTCGFGPQEWCVSAPGTRGLCSSCYLEYECSGRNFACDASGVLRVTEMTALDCSPSYPPYPDADPSAYWTDCLQALESGTGGDSCVGSFLCARPTQETCCIEVAQCSGQHRSADGGTALSRYRVCSDGCRALEAQPELPGPSSCADGDTGPLEAGIPCGGSGYVCAEGHDVTKTPFASSDDRLPTTLRWCGNGVVQAVTDFGNHGL